MFERLESSAGATAIAIAGVLAVAVATAVLFGWPVEVGTFVLISALAVAMLLAAAHTTAGGTPARTRHRR